MLEILNHPTAQPACRHLSPRVYISQTTMLALQVVDTLIALALLVTSYHPTGTVGGANKNTVTALPVMSPVALLMLSMMYNYTLAAARVIGGAAVNWAPQRASRLRVSV